jgi:hypothetical protein
MALVGNKLFDERVIWSKKVLDEICGQKPYVLYY